MVFFTVLNNRVLIVVNVHKTQRLDDLNFFKIAYDLFHKSGDGSNRRGFGQVDDVDRG